MKRKHNEDTFAVLDDVHLYVVADGMGGHASGEVASQMVIETLRDFFEATSADPEATWPYKMDKSRGYEENRLITAIKLANLRIYEAAQKDERLRGMGTTVVALLAVDDGVLVAHVGDSRVYRWRDGELELLTEDHSLLNDYIKMKKLSEEEIAAFPHKNVIVRALGMKENVKVDILLDKPKPGDIYLLCSDGLAGPATDDEIREVMNQGQDLKATVASLIHKANDKGGPDNITAVLAKVMGVG
ncbi:MAG: Stp1/IreP family PP2C-type Ser/Thr phosphatase [Myxococcota bacterium]